MNASAALALFLAFHALAASAADRKSSEIRSGTAEAIQAKFDAIEAKIESSYAVATAQARRTASGLEAQIKSVQGQIKEVKEAITRLEAVQRKLEQTGQKVTDAVGQDNRRKTSAQLEANRASLRRLQEQAAALQSRLSTAENQIAELTKKRATELAAAKTARQRAIEEAKKHRP